MSKSLKNPISKSFLCFHLIEKSSVCSTLPQGETNGSKVVMRQTVVPGYAALSLFWGRGTNIKYLESLLSLVLSETISHFIQNAN